MNLSQRQRVNTEQPRGGGGGGAVAVISQIDLSSRHKESEEQTEQTGKEDAFVMKTMSLCCH